MKPCFQITWFIAVLMICTASGNALAETYKFAVQPFLPAAETRKSYQPLADYLSQESGHTIKLVTSPNFLAYWQTMKKGTFDLILDAAHMTDYRVKKMNYRVLAKVLDVVSLSLVTGEDVFVFDATELVGKRLASLASPSRGALVLNEIFTNPMRQPILIEVTNAQHAVQTILDGKASGAIIPSPLVGNFPQLNVVTTTEQWPHVGFSASAKVPQEVADKIKKALIDASGTPAGQKMLEAVNLAGFEAADSGLYDGFSTHLKSVWGY